MLVLSELVKLYNSIFTQFTSSYTPKKGDIALSRVGSYGISSYADTDEPFCMGQNTVVISTANNSRYLYELLQSRIVRNQFDLSVAGSSQKTLSLKAIKSTYIPCPLNAEKQVITDRCVAVYGNTEKESITLNKYKSIKKGLMQDLLTGKVSV